MQIQIFANPGRCRDRELNAVVSAKRNETLKLRNLIFKIWSNGIPGATEALQCKRVKRSGLYSDGGNRCPFCSFSSAYGIYGILN